MAWSVIFSGSATIGTTEWSLINNSSTIATSTTKTSGMLVLDVNALTIGDQFLLTLYDKCRSGDTQRIQESWPIVGGLTKPGDKFPADMLGEGWDFTLKKLAGTDRAIIWSFRGL